MNMIEYSIRSSHCPVVLYLGQNPFFMNRSNLRFPIYSIKFMCNSKDIDKVKRFRYNFCDVRNVNVELQPNKVEPYGKLLFIRITCASVVISKKRISLRRGLLKFRLKLFSFGRQCL